ncbi:hypothetical protein MGWOODY_Smn3536 [hydrothermal vent metagenome]|uniref:Uncharacterized protein n=1 Tax=hydrothermal vent metagenome TaxID=652676 RepID=A0A160TP45_9ZZZZ
MGGCGAARFPQARRRSACPLRRTGVRASQRGAWPYPAHLVRGGDRPARQCRGRCRDARRADRGGAELGLYRQPARLAGRPGALGGAGGSGRGTAVRRAAPQPDPAFRRQADDDAAAPDRRRQGRPAGDDRPRGRGDGRGACDRAARRFPLHRRRRCAAWRQEAAARRGRTPPGRRAGAARRSAGHRR